jgi:hypothetical protein
VVAHTEIHARAHLRSAIPAGRSDIQPLRGTIEGRPDSWVRLTHTRSGWRGVLSDGHELYAIEPTADIAESTVQPMTAAPGTAPVMYRLADALMPGGPGYCATLPAEGGTPAPGRPTALMAYKAITAELAQSTARPTRRLVIGVVADYEFVRFVSGDPEGAIISRMDIVDGIFSTQVSVRVSLAPLTLFRDSQQPFTKTAPNDLLTELKRYRGNTPAQLALGVTHLMTGRKLDGNIVGIAYMGSVCNGDTAASLSQGSHSTTMSALITAHELGHNFNAPHDGDPGACSTIPQTYLMAPRINFSNELSACSLQQIESRIGSAQCLARYIPPDVALQLPASSIGAAVNSTFTLSFTVQAVGDDVSNDVVANATVPASLTLQSATASGTPCTSGAGTVSCTIGALAPGDSRKIDVNLTGGSAGVSTVALSATSSNDSVAANNSGQVTINLSSAANATAPATQGSAGSGGGGRVDITLLALLGCILARGRCYASTKSRSLASTC